MQTNVLRVGNLVKYKGRILTIKNIHAKSVNLRFDKDSLSVLSYISAADIEPLILTTALLKRFGFREFYNRYRYPDLKDIYIDRKIDKYFLSLDRTELTDFAFVHELQNIFFDVYKVELKYK